MRRSRRPVHFSDRSHLPGPPLGRPEFRSLLKHRENHAGILVGNRHDDLGGPTPCLQIPDPVALCIIASAGSSNHSPGAVDEQRPQVSIPALGYADCRSSVAEARDQTRPIHAGRRDQVLHRCRFIAMRPERLDGASQRLWLLRRRRTAALQRSIGL